MDTPDGKSGDSAGHSDNLASESILNALNFGVMVLDAKQAVMLWNEWLEKRSCLKSEHVVGKSIVTVFSEELSNAFLNAVKNTLDYGLPFVMSNALHRSPLPLFERNEGTEEKVRLHQSITLSPIKDKKGNRCCLVQITDASSSIKREKILRSHSEILKKEATTDSLTGIYNRRFFDEHFKVTLGHVKRHASPLAVFMIDIDYFKQYNDFYGHVAGDKTLVQVASSLRKQLLRASDVVARFGGEEFVLLMPNMNHHDAEQFAERLRMAIWELRLSHKKSPINQQVSISIGYSQYQYGSNQNPENLLKAADAALYEAKRLGRNRAVYISLEDFTSDSQF